MDGLEDKLVKAIEGEILTERPDVKWDDVVGLEKVVVMLKESVVSPFKFPETTGDRQTPCVIWLYGHPGLGKTYITNAAISNMQDVTVFSVSSFTTKHARSRQFVTVLFKLARERRPSVVLIDEIDRFFWNDSEGTSETETEFLRQTIELKENKGVVVIGHTCKPWQLSSPIRQRADREGYLSLPDVSARANMFKHFLMTTANTLTEADYQKLGRHSEGFSPSDIMIVVKDAAMEPVREIQKSKHFKKVSGPSPVDQSIMVQNWWAPCQADDTDSVEMDWTEASERVFCREISMVDVFNCLQRTKPTVTQEESKKFEDFIREFELS